MLQNMMIKGSPYEFDSVFQRKRSLSVPMLFPPLDQSNGSPSGSSDTATITATESEVTTAAIPGNSGVDHDMETDDGPKPVKLFSRSERMKQLMDELREHQESATRVLKSHHNRHQNYAGYPSWYYKNGQNQYTLRHHLHYNPHSYRKFPPYQYWAASAQRNYHMATIGVIPSSISPEFRAIAEATQNGLMAIESALLAFAGGRPPPGVGDRILRTSVRNGGVNKSTVASAYPSRLPVHFRHMTSRTNRRPAICINPLQGDASTTSEQKQVSTGGSAVSKVLPLFSGLSIEESNSPSDSGSTSTSASSLSNRKKLTDWRRVAGLNIDLGGSSQDDDGAGNTMRLARNDSGSDSKSLGGSLTKGITSSRNWMNKRGGLANLLQTKQSQNGDVGSTSGSRSGTGSTVDRLVEEMNKWSV
ncbi:hypothetical protein BGZ46_007882 [Entomortierella lignicola]|nr:hypothetical protein BGZ46_007882 [Entomortierella lignicola]